MGRNERVLYHGHDSITYPFGPEEFDKPYMEAIDLKEEEVVREPQVKQRNVWTRMVHSFKRQEQNAKRAASAMDPEFGIPRAGDTSQLHRKLKSRHIQMIAIGGAIGAGLFIGSGKALSTGGPGAVVLDFSLIGFMLFCTVNALGEMATLFPVQGSFMIFSSRFIDPAWGFAMGWNYAMGWMTIFPFELTAASLTVSFWNSGVSNAVFIAIFWFAVVCINLMGVRGYGEAEFLFSTIKVTAVVAFIILGIVIDLGGSPSGVVYGTKFWHDPGSFNNGFKGICSVFVTAAFAFAGTELAGLTAAETENPKQTLPRATKQVTWRVIIFYVVSLTVIGCIVPYTDPQLLNGKFSADITASPFVIAVNNAGIKVVPSIMNAVILISVLSVGNSSTYGASRTLQALAERGQAPQIFAYIDKRGRPLGTFVLTLGMGLIAFIGTDKEMGPLIFDWLLALSGLSTFFTWGSICLAHIRFRHGMVAQGYKLDDLPFRAVLGIYGSYIGFSMNVLCIVAQTYIAVFPIGGSITANEFFQNMLALPIIVVLFVFWKFYQGTSYVRASEMDLVTGRRELDLAALKQQEMAERQGWPMWKK